MTRRTILVVFIAIAALIVVLAAAVYYVAGSRSDAIEFHVAADGSDEADGTSRNEAWRTLGRVSQEALEPGTTILLHGDGIEGALELHGVHGTAENPITVRSGPDGRASVQAGRSAGILVIDSSHVLIRDLDVVPGPDSGVATDGIRLWASGIDAANTGITVDDVKVSEFGIGVAVGAADDRGFSDVTLSRVVAEDNIRNGIFTYSEERGARAHSNLWITDSEVTGTTGIPGPRGNSGSGIVMGSVHGGGIVGSRASDNGELSDDVEGPIGIWAYSSSHIAITDNVSENNKTGKSDGGGFALDLDVDNSSLARNLSMGNMGPGFLVFANDGISTANNTVRFNASIGDSTDGSYHGGISVIGGLSMSPEGSSVEGLDITRNTVVMDEDSTAPALSFRGDVDDTKVTANLLYARGTGPVIRAASTAAAANVTYCGNAYSPGAGPTAVEYAAEGYTAEFIDFEYWWAAGYPDEDSVITDSDLESIDGDPFDLVQERPVEMNPSCGAMWSADATDLTGATVGSGWAPGAVRP